VKANTVDSKSVTLYLTKETVEKIADFAEATHRTKSLAAEILILHGIANYDIKAAAPKRVAKPKKATAANTRVKKPAAKTSGRKPAAKTPTKANGTTQPNATPPRKRRRSPAASSAAAETQAA
jgi:hypothetical protein